MVRARLIAWLWVAGVALALAWVLLHARVRNDMTSFMPTGATAAQRLLMNELREGPVARLTIITLGGAERDALAAESKRLAARLRSSGHFVRVANGEQLFDPAELERLFAYRYLLSPAVDARHFDEESLRAALERRLRELASPVPTLDRPWLARDPTAEMRATLSAWRGEAQPRRYRSVWFDGEGERALLLAQTRAPGFDLDAQEAAQRVIREAVDGEYVVGVSGPAVFAVDSRAIIRGDTRRLGILAGVVALVILLAGYRSARLVIIGALPLLSAVAAGVVAVSAMFGAIHGIVLAFGITVIGVAIDYPIHLFSHLNAGEGARRTLEEIWPTIRLGAVTTAMGYLAMWGTDFPGLTQFATFAIAGLLAAAACTRWGLVGWLPEGWSPRYSTGIVERYAGMRRPGRRWTGFTLALGVLALAYLAIRAGSPWEDDIAALSPIPESVMAEDRHLHGELGVPDTNHVLLVQGTDPQAALAGSEALAAELDRLVARGVITRFDLPSRYLPSVATQRARQRSLPAPDRLRRDLARAQAGMPFKEDAFAPFVEDVGKARALSPLTPADLEGTALGLRLRSTLLPVEDGWVALVTLSGVRDTAALEDFLARYRRPGFSHLDLKRDTKDLMADFRRHGATRVLWGLAAIALVLLAGLRSAVRTLRVLLPGLLAVLVDVAILLLLGERLSLFHLVSLLLVIGIGIDYGLFFGRRDADARMRARTFHGLVVCVLSTVSVFGILATSSLPVLHGIGFTVAIGVAASFLAAMVLARPQMPRPGPRDLGAG